MTASPTLAALRELLDAVDLRPWRAEFGVVVDAHGDEVTIAGHRAEQIVALYNAAPALLAAAEEAESLRAELGLWKQRCETERRIAAACRDGVEHELQERTELAEARHAAHDALHCTANRTHPVGTHDLSKCVVDSIRAQRDRATTAERELAALRARVEAASQKAAEALDAAAAFGRRAGVSILPAECDAAATALRSLLTTPPAAAPVVSLSAETAYTTLRAAVVAIAERHESDAQKRRAEYERIEATGGDTALCAGRIVRHDFEAKALRDALRDADAPTLPQPRPIVQRFARWMEHKLVLNEHKGGWHNDAPESLLRRVREELDELCDVATARDGTHPSDAGVIATEAADVANMAMMVADVCGALGAEPRDTRSLLGEGSR